MSTFEMSSREFSVCPELTLGLSQKLYALYKTCLGLGKGFFVLLWGNVTVMDMLFFAAGEPYGIPLVGGE